MGESFSSARTYAFAIKNPRLTGGDFFVSLRLDCAGGDAFDVEAGGEHKHDEQRNRRNGKARDHRAVVRGTSGRRIGLNGYGDNLLGVGVDNEERPDEVAAF